MYIRYNRVIVQVKDEADKVPKLQEQIQELSAKVIQSEDKEKSMDEELRKNKSDLEEKKKEIDELLEKLKVCSYNCGVDFPCIHSHLHVPLCFACTCNLVRMYIHSLYIWVSITCMHIHIYICTSMHTKMYTQYIHCMF